MSKEKRLLVLGGGRYQKDLIILAEERGIKTVISDYLPDSPGKKFSTYPTMTDALDIEANVALAREYNVDAVIATGSDQPLNTMAVVAEELNLHCFLTPRSAKLCTNKSVMSEGFAEAGVPQARSVVATRVQELSNGNLTLNFPMVIKPVDSQGQRGISVARDIDELLEAASHAFSFTRDGKIIVEEYVEGPEITVSAWVQEGTVHILMVTDRVTYNTDSALGICFQHVFPTYHARNMMDQIRDVMDKIVNAFQVKNGPLYIQMLVSNDKLYVVEGSCRVGGGHESSLIRYCTGLNVNSMLLGLAFNKPFEEIGYAFDPNKVEKHMLINFLLAKPGYFHKHDLSKVSVDQNGEEEETYEAGFYYKDGYEQHEIIDALGRVGYFICAGDTREKLFSRAEQIYGNIEISDESGENLLFWPDNSFMKGWE